MSSTLVDVRTTVRGFARAATGVVRVCERAVSPVSNDLGGLKLAHVIRNVPDFMYPRSAMTWAD